MSRVDPMVFHILALRGHGSAVPAGVAALGWAARTPHVNPSRLQAGLTVPRRQREDLGSVTTALATLATNAARIGGVALAKKTAAVVQQYGPETAEQFVVELSADPGMKRAYAGRAQLIDKAVATKNTVDVSNARAVAQKVHAAENQVLSRILKMKAAVGSSPGAAAARVQPSRQRVGYRDVAGSGGWSYRQYADGAITIIADPRANGKTVGRVLRDGKAWEAISTEIGPFPAEQASRLPAIANQFVAEAAAGQHGQFIRDAVGVGAAVASGAAAGGTAAAASAVTSLLAAAGVSASVPVAGWIAAGGMAAAAGTVALVKAVKGGKVRRAEIVAHAQANGIPDAADAPDFTARVLRMSRAKRLAAGTRLSAALARQKGRKRAIAGRRRAKLESKLRILAAAELVERAARKGQLSGFSGSRRAAGVGNVHVSELRGLSGNFSEIAPGELRVRLERAKAGNITEGGVVSPREAAAFVIGYITTRYMPALRAQGVLSDARQQKLGGIVAQLSIAIVEPTDAAVLKAVLKIGAASAPIDSLKGALSGVFSRYTSDDPSRNWAVQVLQHAAAILAAANEPTAAAKLTLAAAGDKAKQTQAEAGVLKALQTGLADIVEDAKDIVESARATATAAPAAALAEARKLATGAINAAASGADAATEAARNLTDAATEKAEALAQTGVGEVRELIGKAKDLKQQLVEAKDEAVAEVREQIANVGKQVNAAVAKVQAAGNDVQRQLAAEFKERYDGAVDAVKAAQQVAAQIPVMVDAAVKAKLEQLDALTESAKAKLADPCSMVPASQQARCRELPARVSERLQDPCSLLPFPSSIACRHPQAILAAPFVISGAIVIGYAAFRAMRQGVSRSVEATT